MPRRGEGKRKWGLRRCETDCPCGNVNWVVTLQDSRERRTQVSESPHALEARQVPARGRGDGFPGRRPIPRRAKALETPFREETPQQSHPCDQASEPSRRHLGGGNRISYRSPASSALSNRGIFPSHAVQRDVPSFPRSAWERLLRRSASYEQTRRRASKSTFPRRAWEREPVSSCQRLLSHAPTRRTSAPATRIPAQRVRPLVVRRTIDGASSFAPSARRPVAPLCAPGTRQNRPAEILAERPANERGRVSDDVSRTE